MAFIEKTAFLPRMWNNRNNDLQNIAGKYGTVSSGVTSPADCSAGFICQKGAHLSTGGYQMTVAADGKNDVYICNPGDVQRGNIGNGLYAEGINTLGLGIPAGRLGTYTKAIPGETYAFGEGNFSTLVDATTNKYATIVNGLLVGSSTVPADGTGIYFQLDEGLGIDTWTESNYAAGKRYNLLCCKTKEGATKA